MAGADHSGEEMQTGRTNRAENRTRIWAQREEDSDFDGEAILVVEAAVEVDDDYELVNDGLVAHGVVSSGIGSGAGVVGFNRRNPIFAPGVELSPADLSSATNVGVFGKGTTGVAAKGDFRGAPDQAIVGGRGVGIIGRGDRNLVKWHQESSASPRHWTLVSSAEVRTASREWVSTVAAGSSSLNARHKCSWFRPADGGCLRANRSLRRSSRHRAARDPSFRKAVEQATL
jgi:hypothetical protein